MSRLENIMGKFIKYYTRKYKDAYNIAREKVRGLSDSSLYNALEKSQSNNNKIAEKAIKDEIERRGL